MELSAADKAEIEEIRQDVGALFPQLIAMLQVEYPARRVELTRAEDDRDIVAVRQLAHRLCNSCGAVGARHLARHFRDIEHRAEAGDCSRLADDLRQADALYAAVLRWLLRTEP